MNKILGIVNIVKANKGLSPCKTINDETRLREDLGFDSFDLAELTVRIEDEFGIDIFDDGIVNTIGEIVSKLKIK